MAKDYSIKTEQEKAARKIKVNEFVDKYGDGSIGLTKDQKEERIKKALGNESSKFKLFNDSGVDFYEIKAGPLPEKVKDNLAKYPDDINAIDHESKVLNIEVDDDGTLRTSGISIDGKENNIAERGIWAQESASDEESAMAEKSQFKRKILREVSDRTMAIHEENGDLDVLLEDPDIDTDEDKETQY